MATQRPDTSITDAAARRFIAGAAERDVMTCERIPGLHLMRLKRGGAWRFRYQDASGRRRVATVGSYPAMKPVEAAERARSWRNDRVDVLTERERARREAATAEAQARHRTLRAYLEGPYRLYQDRKKSGGETLAIIKHNFAGLLDRDMASLRTADIREWQVTRESEGRAHTTLRRAFGALKTMLNHAARQDPPVLDENPLARVTLEEPSDAERGELLSAERGAARRLLTVDEIQALHAGLDAFAEVIRAQRRNSRAHGKRELPDLDAVPYAHWFIPFCYCALYTGLRPGDLFSLTWLELNINFGRLSKVPEKTRHRRNPAKVTMDLPAELLTVMKAWYKQQGKPETGLVFPSPITGEQMDKKAHRRAWRDVKRLGGLPENLAFYALRHHFISSLVAAGVPLLVVARLAGHKSASMIESHYGHLCPATAADALTAYSRTVARQAVAP